MINTLTTMKELAQEQALLDKSSNKVETLTRDYTLTSYLPLKAVKELCCCDWVLHYVFILHDRDTDENGQSKTPHFHIMLRLRERCSLKALRRRLDRFTYEFYYGTTDTPQNTLIECTKDIDDMYRYLTHTTEQARKDGKFEYDISDLQSDNLGYWRGDMSRQSTADKNNVALDIIIDIESGLTERQLLTRYGREYLINRTKYREFYYAMIDEECPMIVTDENGEVINSKARAVTAVEKELEKLSQKMQFLQAIIEKK